MGQFIKVNLKEEIYMEKERILGYLDKCMMGSGLIIK